jgi:IS5 family transposase
MRDARAHLNVTPTSNLMQAGALLQGDEMAAHGDAGYRGVHKREEAQYVPSFEKSGIMGRRQKRRIPSRGDQNR